MKGDPFLLRRPAPDEFVRVLRASATAGGHEFPWRLRRLGQMEALAAAGLAAELERRFVDGSETLPPVDGQPVVPSRAACALAATLLTAQCAPAEARYSDYEVFAQMVDGQLLTQLVRLAEEVAPVETDTEHHGPFGTSSELPSSTAH